VEAPDNLGLGHLGQCLEQCLFVAIHHALVFMGQKGANEFGGLRQRSPQQVQEGHAATFLISPHAQQRPEKGVDDGRWLQRLMLDFCLQLVERAHSLFI
jgi:hypothetical protein